MLFTNRRRTLISSLAIILLVTGVGVTALAAGSTASGQLVDASHGLMEVEGTNFPDTVAYANGRPISGLSLAQRIYILEQGQLLNDTPLSLEQAALDQLIREAVLLDAAQEMGKTVSVEEAKDFAARQQQLAITSQDLTAGEMYRSTSGRMGLSPDEFATDSRVIQTYQDALTLGAMYQFIRSMIPGDQQLVPSAFQATLTAFVKENTEEIEILIAQ